MTTNSLVSLDLINSPCVRNCCLDSRDICLGCLRHIDEIIAWKSYSREEKEQIIKICQERTQVK